MLIPHYPILLPRLLPSPLLLPRPSTTSTLVSTSIKCIACRISQSTTTAKLGEELREIAGILDQSLRQADGVESCIV